MNKKDVRAKKHLGQHFLKDENIAAKIVGALSLEQTSNVLEIGPGTGILTKYLLDNPTIQYVGMDVDRESIDYLNRTYNSAKFIQEDFLKCDMQQLFAGEQFSVIGNFPYNISSQILFHIINGYGLVPLVVGMFQKEMAERIAEKPGSKKYGTISVLLQAYYDIEYLFTVSENVFIPPPKVKSGVISLKRNPKFVKEDNKSLFTAIVKSAFNQRRKTLKNSLQAFDNLHEIGADTLKKRPEQIGVMEFIEFSRILAAKTGR